MAEPPVLPVREIGTTIAEDGERLPTAVIDVAGHPEVADLARVHATDGIGDITTEALCLPWGEGHQLLLGVRVTVPVVCTFVLAFDLPAQRQVVDAAMVSERLVIATTDPAAAALDQPLWLAIDLDAEAVAAVLP